ncbi:MAG: hemagglutinin repeat-containing protein, partial [Reinekea sp.]
MILHAGGNLTLDTVSKTTNTGDDKHHKTATEHTGSTVDAGGNMQLSAGEDLLIEGSSVNAGGDLGLFAEG